MFVLATDKDPITAARNVDDGRIRGQIFFVGGVISAVVNDILGEDHPYFTYPTKDDVTDTQWYQWARLSSANFGWMTAYMGELLDRYGKEHKSQRLMSTAEAAPLTFDASVETTMPNVAKHEAYGLDYTHIKNPVTAYRKLAQDVWNTQRRKPTWGDRKKPQWASLNRQETTVKSKAKSKPKAQSDMSVEQALEVLLKAMGK